jgi:Putative adhesin
MMSTLTPLRRAILLVGGLLALGVITVAVLSIVDSLGRTTTERDDTLSTRDGRLIVRNGSGPVDLVPSHDGAVHVHTTVEYGIFQPDVEITEQTGSVQLRSDCRGDWLPFGKCEVRYRIEVPADTDLNVTATTGDITATGLSGKITLHSNAGTISVDRIAATELTLTSNVGDLSATDINTPRIRAQATAGSIMLAFDQAPDTATVHTTVGDVDIALPPTADGYDLRHKTGAGDENVDESIPENHSGKHVIDASTTAGTLTIYPATP